jgi:hypothetical protein
MGSKSTGSDGKASWSYTGTGAGSVGFVAVYDDKESNMVRIDDYTPSATTVTLSANKSSITYGESVTFTATVKDQHGQAISSGTVTFKANGSSIGIGSISSGTATLTKSNFTAGSYNITAEINSVTSNNVALTVNKAPTTLTMTSDKTVITKGETFTLSGVLSYNGTVKIYSGDTLIVSINTHSTGGVFSKTMTPAFSGAHFYRAVFEGSTNYEASSSSDVPVYSDVPLTLSVTGDSFSSYGNNVFIYEGTLLVDWGDGNTESYNGGQLSHTYASSDDYNVKIYGEITNTYLLAFAGCNNITEAIFSSPLNG